HRELRSDGDVDFAGQNHERHPHGDRQHWRSVQREVAEIRCAEKRRCRDENDQQHADQRHGGRKLSRATESADERNTHGTASPTATSDANSLVSCPSARANTRSGVASERSRVATIVPPRMTTIRSLMPRISGSSEEIIKMATPCSARPIINS